MDRRSFLHGVAGSGVVLGASGAVSVAHALSGDGSGGGWAKDNGVQNECARRIALATAAALAMQRADWEQGILAEALLEAEDRTRVILLTKAAIVRKAADGRLAVVGGGGATDPAMGGAAYAKAAEWTGDAQMQAAVDGLVEWIRHKAPRNADGILYHQMHSREMWSDGFNNAPPFLAAVGYYDEALAQIEGYRKKLWNPEHKLLAHIWDDEKGQFQDGNYWGGGNGWAAAGLARVIRSLPRARQTDREHIAAFAREIVDGCLKYQREDGLFHDIIDQPNSFIETNLAQMLAFAIYEGVSDAWLPANYFAYAEKMRTAARAKMDAFGYVQDVCGAPNFNHPGTSTEGQAFCILMEVAGRRAESAKRG